MTIAFAKRGDPVEWGKPMGASGGPLSWRLIVPHDDRPKAFADDLLLLTCVNGHECMLSRKVHAVDAQGVVTPSVVCPVAGCGFHEFVTLADW